MIKFVAGFLTAWIIIKNPSVPADVLAVGGTLMAAIRDALSAAANSNAVG